jgi:hypothetical protein
VASECGRRYLLFYGQAAGRSFRPGQSPTAGRARVETGEERQLILNDGEVRRRTQSKNFDFYRLPAKVLESVAIISKSPALIILCVLYRLRVKTGHNPVILTSRTLRNFKLSRYQKLRALKLLEKTGHISIDRTRGKNLQIMLNWWPH